jgi:hypothetical protein
LWGQLHPVAVTKLLRRHWFQHIGQHFPDFLHLAGFLLYSQRWQMFTGKSARSDLASVPATSRLKNASRDEAVSEERLGAMSLAYPEARTIRDNQMNALPVDRALNIYGALAGRSETKGARERLTRHLMKMYLAGEKDQHRLTVEGLSYLRNLDQEMDSRN